MNLQEAREIYGKRTSKLSEVVRQLNFAGIGIIWVFRVGEKSGGIPYSQFLLWPLGLLIVSATCDILHYAYGSAAWGIFHSLKEKELKHDGSKIFRAPRQINWPSNFFFWSKASSTVVAFALLIQYVAHNLALSAR